MVGRTPVSALKASVSCESIDAPEAWPTHRAAAADQVEGRDLDRVHADADDHQLAAHGEAGDDRAHRLAVGDGRQDGLGAAELVEFGRDILGLAVEIEMGAEVAGQRFLFLAAGDGDGVKTHLGGELHAEMAQSANAENRDQIAGRGAAFAQGVEGGDAGAEQRRGFDRG